MTATGIEALTVKSDFQNQIERRRAEDDSQKCPDDECARGQFRNDRLGRNVRTKCSEQWILRFGADSIRKLIRTNAFRQTSEVTSD